MAKPMQKLSDWRKGKGMSQEEAGRAIGLDQPSWSRYESGAQCPSVRNARKLERLTEGAVTLLDFYPETDDAAPASAVSAEPAAATEGE